jgi:hypothetical protein
MEESNKDNVLQIKEWSQSPCYPGKNNSVWSFKYEKSLLERFELNEADQDYPRMLL